MQTCFEPQTNNYHIINILFINHVLSLTNWKLSSEKEFIVETCLSCPAYLYESHISFKSHTALSISLNFLSQICDKPSSQWQALPSP
jgi:hypothetical protein